VQREVVQCRTRASGVTKRDVGQAKALAGPRGKDRRRARIDHLRFQFQEGEQVAQKEAVGVDLPDLLKQRVHPPLPLAEGLIEKRQIAQRGPPLQHAQDHPGQHRAGHDQRRQRGDERGGTLLPRQPEFALAQTAPRRSKDLPIMRSQVQQT